LDFKNILLFITIIFFAPFNQAELKDPTRPASYSTPKQIRQRVSSSLHLSSIWISDRSKRVTINGVTGKQGEVILSNIKIIKILNDSVVIRQKGKTRKLYLLTSASNLRKTAL
jgi:type II secretory pathway component PulC